MSRSSFLRYLGTLAALAVLQPAAEAKTRLDRASCLLLLETVHSRADRNTQAIAKARYEIHRLRELAYHPDPRSRVDWEQFYREWVSKTRTAIQGSLDRYLAGKAEGHPHVKWLESVGFVFGPGKKNVYVPPFPAILAKYFDRLDALVAAGFPPDELVFPGRVVYNGPEWIPGMAAPKRKDFLTVSFGEHIPEGYRGTTHLIPMPFHLQKIAEGVFPMGESAALGTPSVAPYMTFLLHDIAHLALFSDFPRLMPAIRSAGRELFDTGARFLRGNRGWADSPFTAEQIAALRERNLLTRWSEDAPPPPKPFDRLDDGEIADWINSLPSADRLPFHTLYVAHVGEIKEVHRAGVRYHLFLESASLLDRRSADSLAGSLNEKGLLPKLAPGGSFQAKQIEAHLLSLGPAGIREANAILVDRFPSLVTYYGGANRDFIQNALRFEASGPTGNSHYAAMEYLWFVAQKDRKTGASAEAMAANTAKLAAAAIESGKVDPVEWLKSVAKPVDPASNLYKWMCGTGSFLKDIYWYAYCG